MSTDSLDPVIHAPARLRIVATLAALPHGDALSFTRLLEMLELTPGNLITHLRRLEDAGYVASDTTGNGRASKTSVALTRPGRDALDAYTRTSANCSAAASDRTGCRRPSSAGAAVDICVLTVHFHRAAAASGARLSEPGALRRALRPA